MFIFHFSALVRTGALSASSCLCLDTIIQTIISKIAASTLDLKSSLCHLTHLHHPRTYPLPHQTRHPLSPTMITDLILLLILFAILFGIVKLVSLAAPPPASTKSPSASTGSSSGVKLGSAGSTLDWQHGQVNLKTNMRPVTQQEILERADQTGRDGGKFMSDHASSFTFGKKDTSGL